jgi:hypothetical protein
MSTARKLGPEELAYLHDYCKKKDIIYIDLRIELVDHLAELIQARWAEHPTEDFRTAFHNVYKSFGIFGFMEIAEQHQAAMQKRYRRGIWQFFKSWLTPPKVLATGFLFTLIYLLVSRVDGANNVVMIGAGIVFLASIVLTVWQYQSNKKIMNNEKNMLMGGSGQGLYWFGYFLWIIIFNSGLNANEYLTEQPWFVATIFLVIVLFTAANYSLLKKAKEELIALKEKLAVAG